MAFYQRRAKEAYDPATKLPFMLAIAHADKMTWYKAWTRLYIGPAACVH